MPVLISAQPSPKAEISPFGQTEDTPLAEGKEGQQLQEQMESVSRHWHQRLLEMADNGASDLLNELSDYRHPSCERVGTLRVRFTRINHLKPRTMVFELAEDEE